MPPTRMSRTSFASVAVSGTAALAATAVLPVQRAAAASPAPLPPLDPSALRAVIDGLQQATVNGVTLWGKTGDMYGFKNAAFSTRDRQRRFVLAYHPTTARDGGESQMIVRVADLLAT